MIEDQPKPAEASPFSKTAEPATTNQVTTDYDRDRGRRRMITLLAAGFLVAAAGGAWMYLSRKPAQIATQPHMAPSEPVFQTPQPRQSLGDSTPARLVYEPLVVDFGTLRVGENRKVVSITVTATGGPVEIGNITLPFAQQSGLDMRADGCLNRRLLPNERCAVVVSFSPTSPINLSSNIIVHASGFDSSGDSQGRARQLSNLIEIAGEAVRPPPPPPGPVMIDRDADVLAASRDAFLRNRQQAGGLSSQGGDNGWRAPRQTDRNWQSAGFQPTMSTMPVDMSRILTMDKPIPAVIKTSIDTRHPSRAVATVERDVYGGDGRTVVIERGSTLVGQVASVGEASEEKIAVAWQRLVRPDGVAFGFRGSSGNASGQSGVNALIDNRFFDRFGRTFLASMFTGGVTIALGGTTSAVQNSGTGGQTSTTTLDARGLAGQQIRQDMIPVFDQFRREQLSLPPLRNIPAGTRITVWPTTDLMLTSAQDEPTPVVQRDPTGRGLGSQNSGRTQNSRAPAPVSSSQPPMVMPTVPNDSGPGAIIPSADPTAAPIGSYSEPPQDTSLSSETASQRLNRQITANDAARAAQQQHQHVPQSNYAPVQGPAGQVVIQTPWSVSR